MAALEQIKPGALIGGIVSDTHVEIVAAPNGSGATPLLRSFGTGTRALQNGPCFAMTKRNCPSHLRTGTGRSRPMVISCVS